jgi:hypothetical protein
MIGETHLLRLINKFKSIRHEKAAPLFSKAAFWGHLH